MKPCKHKIVFVRYERTIIGDAFFPRHYSYDEAIKLAASDEINESNDEMIKQLVVDKHIIECDDSCEKETNEKQTKNS